MSSASSFIRGNFDIAPSNSLRRVNFKLRLYKSNILWAIDILS
ncbi:hypothetical protein LSO10F_40050 [Candidatus Liberibacter solanacearum]